MRRHHSFDPIEDVSHQAESDTSEVIDAAREAEKDEDRTLAFSALGLLAVAITAGGVAAARRYHHIKKHEE